MSVGVPSRQDKNSFCGRCRRDCGPGEIMQAMFSRIFFFVLFLASTIAASFSLKPSRAVTADKREIERGRYLVEEVAKCTECHTPRGAQGQLEHEAWLQGAPIWIMPVRPIANWADRAPALAGLPSLTEQEAERVLEQGTGPEGETLRPPMHIYHMNHEDAHAIVAYLKSLPKAVH